MLHWKNLQFDLNYRAEKKIKKIKYIYRLYLYLYFETSLNANNKVKDVNK